MDPLTIAARGFIEAHEAAWDPPPGLTAPKILRIEVARAHRSDALKSLRLLEWRPDNRRPFAIVEAPFASVDAYVQLVRAQLTRDVAAVDKGLQEDGEARPAFNPNEASDAPTLIQTLETAAAHLATALDGLVVVLAPSAVLDTKAFAALIGALCEARPDRQTALRLDVLGCDCPALSDVLPISAAFQIDDEELFDYLRDLGTTPSSGPPPELPPLSREQHAKIEAELGQPIVSVDAGRTLKRLFMDAGKALNEKKPKVAVRKYRAARMLAEATGLKREALFSSMALGSAYAALAEHRGARAAFERARDIAQELSHHDAEAQALFGLGYVHMAEGRFHEAALVYHAAERTVADDSPLAKEARRMLEAAKRGDKGFGLAEAAR